MENQGTFLSCSIKISKRTGHQTDMPSSEKTFLITSSTKSRYLTNQYRDGKVRSWTCHIRWGLPYVLGKMCLPIPSNQKEIPVVPLTNKVGSLQIPFFKALEDYVFFQRNQVPGSPLKYPLPFRSEITTPGLGIASYNIRGQTFPLTTCPPRYL